MQNLMLYAAQAWSKPWLNYQKLQKVKPMGRHDWLGCAAASLATLPFIPPLQQIMRTRDTRAISLPIDGAFTLGVAL
jgi:hypothetical protein